VFQHVNKLELVYQRSGAASQPVRLAPRSEFLVGRDELLAGLQARLADGDEPRPRTAVLYGLGGTGKTSVAVEYAHRHLAEVGVAWQFAADDPAVLAAGFGELAAQLSARELADTRDPVATVHAVLARLDAGWLLIFDNAPDLDSVAAFLPPAGPGRVLITSQNPDWPARTVHVPVLEPGVAAGFLTSRTRDHDREAAETLARELGGLPLALEQAAAYTRTTGLSLAGYLELTRQRRSAVLSRRGPAGYGKTVATTWTLAFARLEQARPAAIGLLRLLACYAPDAIPLRTLLKIRPELSDQLDDEVAAVLMPVLEDPLAPSDAVAALHRYSLVTPVHDGSVSVHALVQAVTVDQMPDALTAQWRRAAAALIEAAIPADGGRPENWPVFASLLPHAEAALDIKSAGMGRIVRYLDESGNYAAASELMGEVLAAREEAFGAEDLSVLAARGQLASLTGAAGDAAGARDQYAALLPVFERVFGPENPNTLVTRANLAAFTGEAGEAAKARDQFAMVVPLMESVVGPEHAVTLNARADLAVWTMQAGDAAQARDQMATLVPVAERVLGPEHLNTLVFRGNLAEWTGEAGDGTKARDQFTSLLPVVERVLGPEHPNTLSVLGNLAQWTEEMGDAAGARDQYASLLPQVERVHGPEHPRSLQTRLNLAECTGEAGDAAGARDLYAALVPVMARVHGAEHPATLTARANAAVWTGEAGDTKSARDELMTLLPTLDQVLGREHPMTLTARSNLATWTKRRGKAAEARDELAGLIPVMERVFGPNHRKTLEARVNLAGFIGEAGDAAGARDRFAALVPDFEQVLGLKHPKTLETRAGLATWVGEAGNASRAAAQLSALLPVFAQVFGSRREETRMIRSAITHWRNKVKENRMGLGPATRLRRK